MKSNSNKGKHLTLEERRIILKGIENGSDKASIAKTIGKDKSTISKEIKKHRVLAHKNKMALERKQGRFKKSKLNVGIVSKKPT